MKKIANYPSIILFVIAIQIFIFSTTMFTAWPEMMLWPYLMLKGWLPYENIAIAHTPLLFTTLSVWYGILGIGATQLKIFTWIVSIATTYLVYITTNAKKSQSIPVLSALLYSALNFIYEGNGLWFDLLLAPLALLIYTLINKKHYFSSGVVLALMLLTKQTAVWFLPIIFIELFNQRNRVEALKKSFIGFSGSMLIFVLVLSTLNLWPSFWRWAVEFGVFTLPRSQGQISYPAVRQIAFALLPFLILIFTNRKSLSLWALAGALGAYPRFELFHFQPALPFLALAASDVIRTRKTYIYITYYFVIIAMFAYTFINAFSKPTRFLDEDTIQFSKYLNSITDDNSEVLIINDWDNIYSLSSTLPATDVWVPHLSWYMSEEMQNEMVSDLKVSQPNYIIYRQFDASGLGSFKPSILMNYVSSNYMERGKVNGRIIMTKI